jgi:hypothetical protein
MARFFFHLKSGDELITDDDGIDLPGLSEATREALQSAPELLAEAIKAVKPALPEALVVTDEAGDRYSNCHWSKCCLSRSLTRYVAHLGNDIDRPAMRMDLTRDVSLTRLRQSSWDRPCRTSNNAARLCPSGRSLPATACCI